MPGTRESIPNLAAPVALSRPSKRRVSWPTTVKSFGFLSGTVLKLGTGSFEAATASAVVIDFRIGGRLVDFHVFPIDAQLFRQDHGKSRHNPLAHFGFAQNERDAIVRSDADPGVERIESFLFLVLRLIGKSARREMEADDERHTSGGTRLEKITAIYNWSDYHGAPRNEL